MKVKVTFQAGGLGLPYQQRRVSRPDDHIRNASKNASNKKWSSKVGLLRKSAAALAVVTGACAISFAGIPAANATDLVTCGTRTDFYETIKTNNSYFCFANYGDITVTVYDTISLSTGNNDGWITYYDPGTGTTKNSTYRGHWYYGSFPYGMTTTAVHLR